MLRPQQTRAGQNPSDLLSLSLFYVPAIGRPLNEALGDYYKRRQTQLAPAAAQL